MRDPTHTQKLRQMYRGEAQRKIRTLLSATQDMLVGQEALTSINHPMALVSWFRQQLANEQANRLDAFTSWFNGVIYSTVVQEGRWVGEHARRAYAHGLKAGEHWTKAPLIAQPAEIYLKFYRNEIEGIADVTVQQVTRAVSTGLLNRESSRKIYRRVVAVAIKVLEPRLYALGHQAIVQQHNLGILAQLKAAGHTHVGVIPETIPRKVRVASDAVHVHDQEIVQIQTAEDDDVCDICIDLADSGPYELAEAETLIPAHINCRCSVYPVIDFRFEGGVRRIRGTEVETEGLLEELFE